MSATQHQSAHPSYLPPDKSGWASVTHFDAKLANLGSTCYLNSTLQALFHTKPFVKWLLNVPHKCKSTICLTCQLKKTFGAMATASKTSAVHKPVTLFAILRVVLKDMELTVKKQEDAHEFFLNLVEQLLVEYFAETGLRRSPEEDRKSPLGHMFQGCYISTCTCSQCKTSSFKFEPFHCLTLSITSDKVTDVDTALKSNFNSEIVEYKCDKCQNCDNNTKSLQIYRPPNVLAIVLKRFDSKTNLKIVKQVPINLFVNIKETQYSLRSVVVHIGERRTSGHYYTYAKCATGSFAVLDDNKEIEHVPYLPLTVDGNNYLIIYEKCNKEIQHTHSSTPAVKPALNVFPLTPSVRDVLVKQGNRQSGTFNATRTTETQGTKVQQRCSSTPLKGPAFKALPSCSLSPVAKDAPIKPKKRQSGNYNSTMIMTDMPTETQGTKIHPGLSSTTSRSAAVRVLACGPPSSILKPANDNKRKGRDSLICSPKKVRRSDEPGSNMQPLPVSNSSLEAVFSPTLKSITPKQKKREVGASKVSPLKIIRSQRLKKSPTKSAHEYFIKTSEGIKNKVSPLKIVRKKRAKKATSTQSSNEYFLKPNAVSVGNPQSAEPYGGRQSPMSFFEDTGNAGNIPPDVVLYPGEVAGAILPKPIISDNNANSLKRWLKCYGFPSTGNKDQLIARVQAVIDMGQDKHVVPDIDGGKYYNEKLAAHGPSQQQPITFPGSGWQTFPSVKIPSSFNLGHIYFYLVESMPHVSDDGRSPLDSGSDSSALEEEERLDFDDPQSEESTMNHHKKFRRGLMYLKSGHVGQVQNYLAGSVYYVKSKVKASMELTLYNVQIALSVVSGSVKICTCDCKQRALAVTCTSRPCEWNQGSLKRNPGNVREKTYPAYKIDVKRRQKFDPRATQFQRRIMTQSEINRFLGDLSGGSEKTRFEYHLTMVYEDYTLDMKQRRRLLLLCRQFIKNQRYLICKEIPPTDENPLPSYIYEELPPNTVFEVPGTGLQGQSDVWLGRRSVVLGASVSHRVCHLTTEGVKGFLRSVLWGMNGGPTAAMKYGTRMEPFAREAYMQEREMLDENASISFHMGFHINSSFLAGGCSPDGIVHSDKYEDILLEIKCPFILKNIDPELFDSFLNEKQMARFCIERDRNGVYQLKKDHQFYYQVQQSLGILGLNQADFVVFSKYGKIIARVDFDDRLYHEIVRKVTDFQREYLIPEYFEKRAARNLTPISLDY